MKKGAIFFLVLVLSALPFWTPAQHHVGIQGDVILPISPTSDTYGTSWGMLFQYRKYEPESKFFFDISLGYQKFTPQTDTVYYIDRYGGDGILIQGSRTTIPILFGLGFPFLPEKLTEYFKPYLGLSTGFNYTTWSFFDDNSYQNLTSKSTEGKFACSPRIGINAYINERVLIGIECRYNLQVSMGSDNFYFGNYNENLGEWEHYLTTGLNVLIRVK